MNGAKVPALANFLGKVGHAGLAMVSLQRGADGSYVASDPRYAGYRSQGCGAAAGQPGAMRRPAAGGGMGTVRGH